MQSVAAGTVYVVIFTVVSKILGLLRNVLTAALFGTSWRMDAVLIAMKPSSLAVAIFAGAIATALVPIYVKTRLEDEERSKELAWSLVFWTSIVYIGVSVIFILFPHVVVKIFAPGFSEEILDYAARKIKYTSLLMIVMGVQTVLGSILRGARKFFQYGVSMVVYNVVAIPVLWMTADDFGEAAYILASISGSFFVTLLMMILSLKSILILSKPDFSIVSGIFKGSLYLMFSRVVTVINPIVDNAFASLLPAGRISSLNYSIVVLSQANVFSSIFIQNAYTELAENVAKEDEEKTRERMRKSISSSLNVSIPLILWMASMPDFFVGILFERGRFTAESTGLVSGALIGYALAFLLSPVYLTLYQFLISIGRHRLIMEVSILAVILNAFFDWAFLKPLQHVGIALSTSMVSLSLVVILYFVVKEKIGDFFPWKEVLMRLSIGISMMLVVMNLNGFGKIAIGSVMFFSFLIWSMRDEIKVVIGKFRKKLRR